MSKMVEKFVLNKMKNVLIKEMSRGYYQNAANIREFVDLEGNGQFVDIDGIKCYHVNSICIYQNDMVKFNNLYFRAMEGFPILEDKNIINFKKSRRKRY